MREKDDSGVSLNQMAVVVVVVMMAVAVMVVVMAVAVMAVVLAVAMVMDDGDGAIYQGRGQRKSRFGGRR